MSTEITTPVGRLVMGHPMVGNPVTDDTTKQPKMQRDGVTPMVDFFVALAIPKGAETDWKQTEWGQKIVAEGVAAWPNGEHMQPTFAWKIIDGDSQIPNKAGKIPCQREGWAGHWIVNASNGFPISCFYKDKYNPLEQIQRKEEIKRGDYARLVINVKGNSPSPSPGVYINPSLFELYQAGVEIVSENAPDAAAAFGGTPASLPANAQIDPNVNPVNAAATPSQPIGTIPTQNTAPAPGTIAPAPDILTPPADFNVNHQGTVYAASALRAAGWTEEQIAALPRV